MSRVFENTVSSISKPPTVIVFIPEEQFGWCKQLSEEGYNVYQITPNGPDTALVDLQKAFDRIDAWALITYGIGGESFTTVTTGLPVQNLRAVVHICPVADKVEALLLKYADATYIPTLFHLASSQENLHASAVETASSLGYVLPTSAFPPIQAHVYPRVTASPPFPFAMPAPALTVADKPVTVDIYVRSAVSLSYSRTLELLRRHLGPHFDLEQLWEKHTHYEFAERDALKTMSTMVSVPYVNHVPTMTGGVGFENLARFYKYHFTRKNVTPPDTELIPISRTVGADRIIDEMIFKCTHTTEIDYFLPGVKPTGRPLELTVVGVVAFRGDKLTFDYWDQASALVQLGLLKTEGLPVAGVEVARKAVDPFGLPSNTLMEKWKESEGLPLR